MASLPSRLPTRARNYLKERRAREPLPSPTAQGGAPFAAEATGTSHPPQGGPALTAPRVLGDPGPASPHLERVLRRVNRRDSGPGGAGDPKPLTPVSPHSHFRCRANLGISPRGSLRARAEIAFPKGAVLLGPPPPTYRVRNRFPLRE